MKDIEPVSAASLIDGARRDLRYAEQLLAHDGDRLVAVVAVARAAKRADEAAFALLAKRDGSSAEDRTGRHEDYDRGET